MSAMQEFKAMSAEDKEALRQLQAEETKRTGTEVKLLDIIEAITPGRPDPAYLGSVPT